MNQTRVAFPGVTDYWTRCKVSSNAITIKKKKNTKRKEIYGPSTKIKKKFTCFYFPGK